MIEVFGSKGMLQSRRQRQRGVSLYQGDKIVDDGIYPTWYERFAPTYVAELDAVIEAVRDRDPGRTEPRGRHAGAGRRRSSRCIARAARNRSLSRTSGKRRRDRNRRVPRPGGRSIDDEDLSDRSIRLYRRHRGRGVARGRASCDRVWCAPRNERVRCARAASSPCWARSPMRRCWRRRRARRTP